MPDPTVNIRPLIGLPPEDTQRAFDARGELRTTARWHEMWQEEHARAFTVAHLARLDLLDDIRNSLADVLANGGTFADWQRNIVPTLAHAGWWGRVEDASLTGTEDPIIVGPRRIGNIYRTNMRVSRAAGQWARIQDRKDVAPYLAYFAIDDGHARPLHALWGGLQSGHPRIILRADDPTWDWLYPPNDWGCRCYVLQLTEEDLRRRGWTLSQPPTKGDVSVFWRAGSPTPEAVPEGIGAGWAYNAGKASMRAIADKAVATLERAAVADLAGARQVLRELIDAPGFPITLDQPDTSFPVMLLDDALRDALGAEGRVGVLSSATFATQRLSRPDIGIPEYRRLPDIGTAPDLVFQQGDQRLIFMRQDDGRWLKATVAVDANRGGPVVTSLEWTKASEVRRLNRRLPLVFGQIAGALAALIAADIAKDKADAAVDQEAGGAAG